MEFEVPINSNIFNTLEYALFDLLIAAAVLFLTSKLVGLYNCYHAFRTQERSHLVEDVRAPLFETGIVCTKRRVFYAIVGIRALSWILIVVTNVFVRGQSNPVVLFSKASVITRGSFSIFDPTALLRQRRFRRQVCVRRTPTSSYYGEIRNGTCETRRELFSTPGVEFGLNFVPTQVTTRGCAPQNHTAVMFHRFSCNATKGNALSPLSKKFHIGCVYNHTGSILNEDSCYIEGNAPRARCIRLVHRDEKQATFECGIGPISEKVQCNRQIVQAVRFSLCDNAVVACDCTGKQIFGCSYKPCSGLVSINGVTHMCEDLDLGNLNKHPAKCMTAKGADWNFTEWLPAFGGGPYDTISNVLAVAYGSGVEEKMVKVFDGGKEKSITRIHVLWIVVLAGKVLMVLALYVSCEILSRRYGLFVVANDETRIFTLVSRTISRIRGTGVRANTNTPLHVTLRNGVAHIHED